MKILTSCLLLLIGLVNIITTGLKLAMMMSLCASPDTTSIHMASTQNISIDSS